MIRSSRGPELSAPILTPDNTAATLVCQGNTALAARDQRSTFSERTAHFTLLWRSRSCSSQRTVKFGIIQ